MKTETIDPIILLVDDNRMYREAVRRNLEFYDFVVNEAQDKSDAIDKINRRLPDLIITDLDMKTPTEGLDLIKEVKSAYPMIPIILISAVGTFDEGALAREYGATHVISKSRIDGELDDLYNLLERTFEKQKKIRNLQSRVLEAIEQGNSQTNGFEDELQQFLVDPETDTILKGEMYDLLLRLRERESAVDLANRVPESTSDEQGVREQLHKEISGFKDLQEETQSTLVAAERTRIQYESNQNISADRMTSFAYCFAVENEVKQRIGRKVVRLLTAKKTLEILHKLYDKKLRNLDLFFNRDLLMQLQKAEVGMSVDLIAQVIERIVQHGEKYKPDGLKALGVIIYCFGRNYSCKVATGQLNIENPLNINGLDNDGAILLASRLIHLQHLRNPYIHPEFSEREQIEQVREVAIDCVNLVSQVN